MKRREDRDQTLIYADVLGFAALVDKHKVRVRHTRRSKRNPYSGSSTTPIQSVFYRFNTAIDIVYQDQSTWGGFQAMVFSDCAYLVAGNPFQGVQIATALMRRFLDFRVPVRMGIGQGTFYDFEYSTNTNDGSGLVSKSRFMGTGCLRAYAAEQCGGKGMRIFVDSSLKDAITPPQQNNRVLPLPKPLKTVGWELNYLYEDDRLASEKPTADESDRKLFENVAAFAGFERQAEGSAALHRHSGRDEPNATAFQPREGEPAEASVPAGRLAIGSEFSPDDRPPLLSFG